MRTVGQFTSSAEWQSGHRAAHLAAKGALAAAVAVVVMTMAGVSPASAATSKAAHAAKSAQPESADKTMVDINDANAETLTSLPGIGPSIAQRIVEYRKEHGPFKSVDELVNVRGVGEKLLGRLRDHITIGAKQ